MAVMRTQTVEQGRYLGGRAPHGYRLGSRTPSAMVLRDITAHLPVVR